jgi:hypothetical protein
MARTGLSDHDLVAGLEAVVADAELGRAGH